VAISGVTGELAKKGDWHPPDESGEDTTARKRSSLSEAMTVKGRQIFGRTK